MNNIDALIDWLKVDITLAGADCFRGPWEENDNNREMFLVSLMGNGGGGQSPYTRQQNIRVIILAPIGGNSQELDNIAASTLNRLLGDDYKACGIAQIEVIGGIIGPGITAENRPWCEINFQLITK